MSNDQQFKEFLVFSQHRVENSLKEYLPSTERPPVRLHEAMHYAALGPGKRIRPMLVYAVGQTLGISPERLCAPACAVELIHAYSLVHDDMPAMDNDDLRRGRPTCHVKYDEATAMLVGDALQTLAFHILSKDEAGNFSAETRLKMIEQLAFASGSRGMCGGQAIDLDATGKNLDLVELENMHIHKTGALIRASVKLGAFADEQLDDSTRKTLITMPNASAWHFRFAMTFWILKVKPQHWVKPAERMPPMTNPPTRPYWDLKAPGKKPRILLKMP